jgi:hypothetical protein
VSEQDRAYRWRKLGTGEYWTCERTPTPAERLTAMRLAILTLAARTERLATYVRAERKYRQTEEQMWEVENLHGSPDERARLRNQCVEPLLAASREYTNALNALREGDY